MKRANKSRVQFKSEPVWTTVSEKGSMRVTPLPPLFNLIQPDSTSSASSTSSDEQSSATRLIFPVRQSW
jgi:hypothetical protein